MPPPTNNAESFPDVDGDAINTTNAPGASPSQGLNRTNTSNTSSSISGRLRRVSQSFSSSEIPEGFSAATGGIASSIFSRQGPRKASATSPVSLTAPEPLETLEEPHETATSGTYRPVSSNVEKPKRVPTAAAPYPNGYHFPPSHTFGHSTKLGLIAFWNYLKTPLGFIVTIYGLNIVAWGGMLFLLLCNASPAMCYPSCNDINSPRRKWIEWNSQTLNALFCVTGFGLAPWRFRDLYYLMKYRLWKDPIGLRRLAGIHRDWFRLKGSQELPVDLGPKSDYIQMEAADASSLPYPESKVPDPPLTGVRAPATKVWKLDLVIWLMVWNTFLQVVLSVFMWSMNRYDRPSWSTGLFVALACIVAAVGGLIMFLEGKSVKSAEGVPVSQEDLERLETDRRHGIYHYNNIKDEDVAAKEAKKAKRSEKSTDVV